MAGICDYLFYSGLVDVCYDIFNSRETICKCVVVGAGGVVTVTFTAALLTTLGFTAAGIAANSIAAKLMSWFAIANGGGVPAGGLVAWLQSLGATGFSATVAGLTASFGGFLGWLLSSICGETQTLPQCDANPTPFGQRIG